MQITLRPDRLVAGGDAMGRGPDGRVVFVRGALPGELVTVEVDAERRDFLRGRVAEVLEESPRRVLPACRHRRAGCGGCGWMHLADDAQMEAKVEIARESLRRIGRLDADEAARLVRRGAAVPGSDARTTLRVVGGPDRRAAFRREASDECVAVDSCQVAHPNLERILGQLDIAPELEVDLRTSVATGAVTARWKRGAADAVRGVPPDVHVGDRAWLVETIAGHDLRVSAASFFQSSAAGAELLVAAVGRAAPELAGASHVVDAYGGVGLFAVCAAPTTSEVTVVEAAGSSCADAEHNLAGRSARVVRTEVGRWRAKGPPVDVVIADPARPGLGKPGVEVLAALGASPFVLVSCDPASLGRDAALLAHAGYRPTSVEVLDLFPHTPHIEAVTRFERG